MNRIRSLALLLSVLAGMASPFASGPFALAVARADDPEPEVSDGEEPTTDPAEAAMHRRWDRLFGIEITGGVENTPYGIVGGAVLIQPHRMFRIDLGAGGSRDGVRVGGGVSLVAPQDHFALTIRFGMAAGPLSWNSGGSPTITRYWDFAAFLNGEFGLEYRFDEGVLIRLYAGVETTLNDTADSCVAEEPGAQGGAICAPFTDHPARVFLGLSVGYMFDFLI